MKLKSDKKEFIGNQKSTKVDQRLTKQNLTKGAYFYYVDKILDFFDPLPPFVDILFSKIGIFLTPPPPLRVYVEKVCPLSFTMWKNSSQGFLLHYCER